MRRSQAASSGFQGRSSCSSRTGCTSPNCVRAPAATARGRGCCLAQGVTNLPWLRATLSPCRVWYPVSAINILKAHGKSARESRMLDGYALNLGRAAQVGPRLRCWRGALRARFLTALHGRGLLMGGQVCCDRAGAAWGAMWPSRRRCCPPRRACPRASRAHASRAWT